MTLYVDAKDPERIDFIVPATDDFDPSTATGWVAVVSVPDGNTVEWSLTVESANATQAHLRHVFDSEGGDVPVPGTYKIQITCDTPAGARRTFNTPVSAQET